VIALLERAAQLLSGFAAITRLADHAFPSAELLGWFEVKLRWYSLLRLGADTLIQGATSSDGL
jgi:hypothetical protein